MGKEDMNGSVDLLAKAMRRVFDEEISEQVETTSQNMPPESADVERRAQERLPTQA